MSGLGMVTDNSRAGDAVLAIATGPLPPQRYLDGLTGDTIRRGIHEARTAGYHGRALYLETYLDARCERTGRQS